MPKFDPRQQQKKLRRHNPIAKSSNGTTGNKGPSGSKQQQQRLSDDAIPLLAHLPLSQSQASGDSPSIEEDEKRHRALLGLNPLLLSKASRSALLAPQHQLLQRLLNHLDHPRLEVRKEAAGCLRNLCVQGKWTGREQIWKLGGGATALAQIEYAAGELGFLPRSTKVQQPQEPQAGTDAPAKKPEEMNRKERRHAAKAAAKAGPAKDAIDASQVLPAPATATPASAAAEADAHDLHLLHLSLLENHLTILWCLLETVSSPVWLISLNRSTLGQILIAAISRAAKTFHSAEATPAGKADAKELKEVKTAQLEVAFTAGSLLAAWLEDNPAGCASIAGLPLDLTEQVIAFEQAGSSAKAGTKSRKRLDTILDKFGGEITDSQVEAAMKRIDGLTSAVELLSDTATTSTSDLARANLALLSLGSCCNLLSSLPASIRSCVPAPSNVANSSIQTLTQWQTHAAMPLLLAFLNQNRLQEETWTKADVDAGREKNSETKVAVGSDNAGMDVDATRTDGNDEEDEKHAAKSMAVRKAETLTLAVELLGEICTEAESEETSVAPPLSSSEPAEVPLEDGMDEDAAGENDDDADSLTSEQEEEMMMLAEADRGGANNDGEDEGQATDADGDMSMSTPAPDTQANGKAPKSTRRKTGFAATPYAVLVADSDVPSTLLDLLEKSLSAAAAGSAATPSSTEFSLAGLNTLAALLSGLASHAHPPPTHPLEEGSREERRVERFIAWVTQQGDRLGGIWSRLVTLASQVASHTSLLALSVPLWTSLHALTVCHEGVDEPLPYLIEAASLKSFFGSSLDQYLALSTSTTSSEEQRQYAIETSSLILSQLAYLARVPSMSSSSSPSHLDRVSFATSTYLTLLLSLKTIPLKVALAALNALIDTFADEVSEWDIPVFRRGQGVSVNGSIIGNGGVLPLLKDPRNNIAAAFKDKIRTVDARKNEEHRVLKEEAEEALDNFKGWLAFRESVH